MKKIDFLLLQLLQIDFKSVTKNETFNTSCNTALATYSKIIII